MLKQRFEIINNYTVLHFDEWDVLFSGKNAYDEWIVGSLAYDDEENNILHHYFLMVSEKSLTRFLKRDISYRTLFKDAITIFKTLRDINENLIGNPLELVFEEISKKSLPSERSFCPESDEQKELLKLILKHEMTFSNNWGVFNLDGGKIFLRSHKSSNFLENKKMNNNESNRNTRKYAHV